MSIVNFQPRLNSRETGNAINKRAPVAMEIKYKRPPVSRWKMPSCRPYRHKYKFSSFSARKLIQRNRA